MHRVDETYPPLRGGQLERGNATQETKCGCEIKEEGENDQGQLIQEGYSNYWGTIRSVAGLQIEYVDLYYTGKFLDGLTTVESGDEYTLDSDVGYFQDLKDRYAGIMGLQEDNLALIIEDIRKKLIKEFRDGR